MTRMRTSAAVAGVFLAAAVLLTGCSAGNNGSDSASGTAADEGSAAAPESKPGAGQAGQPGTDSKGAPAAQPTISRAIIKTGSLAVEVEHNKVSDQRQKA